jgi:protein TonB
MPRDLFGDVTRPSISIGNRKWYTVPVSLLSHSAVVFAVIVIPLLATDVLPEPWEKIDGVIIPLAPPPPPPPPPLREIKTPPPAIQDAVPVEAPTGFAPERDRPEVPWREPESANIVMGTVESPESLVAPPPRPAEQPPVRVGGAIRQPQRIKDVAPMYPAIAQAARVQGIVIIEATISAEGQVVNTRVLRSVPLLDDAALEAVRQWQYTPTLLNGVPVPVIMTVTVQFTLK